MQSEREADGGLVNTAGRISIPSTHVHHPFFTRALKTRRQDFRSAVTQLPAPCWPTGRPRRIVGVHTIAGRPIRHSDKRPGAIGASSSGRKPLATGAAPVSVLVLFAEVRGRPRRTGPDHSSRSQTTLTCRERTSTDLESVLGVSPRESGSRIPLRC
jgi:hypothetical protein